MSLAKKLNLKPGTKLHVIGKPPSVDLDDVVTGSSGGEAVLVFVKTAAEIGRKGKPAIDAAKQDRISWLAYPKAGQLGTDLNRDILWQHVAEHAIEGVRQIAIDEVWSAMRFRPSRK